jgi:hypothetical protein
LTLLISPSAIVGIGLLGILWMYVIRQTQDGGVRIYGKQKQIRTRTIFEPINLPLELFDHHLILLFSLFTISNDDAHQVLT